MSREKYKILAFFPAEMIGKHEKILVQNIVIVINGGLILIYMLLMRVLINASNTFNQKDNLDQKNQELEKAYGISTFHFTLQSTI